MRTIDQMKDDGLITFDPFTGTYEANVTDMTDEEIGLVLDLIYFNQDEV